MNRESAHVKDIKTARKKSMRCELVLQNVMESERHFPLFRQIFRCENRINAVLWISATMLAFIVCLPAVHGSTTTSNQMNNLFGTKVIVNA